MKFDKITCYSILGKTFNLAKLRFVHKKLLLLNKTKEVTKTSLFSVISSNIERILKEKVWMIRCVE